MKYKTYKHFDANELLFDLDEFEEELNDLFVTSDSIIYFNVEENDSYYEKYEIALRDWLVCRGAEYGERVYLE